MLAALLIVLGLLWLMGYIHVPGVMLPNFQLFIFNGHPIRLWDILVFLIIIWIIELVPAPIRQIAVILVLLWVLSILGILVINGVSNLLLLAIIIGGILALLR